MVHEDVDLLEVDLFRRDAFRPLGDSFPSEFQCDGLELCWLGDLQDQRSTKHCSASFSVLGLFETLKKQDRLCKRNVDADTAS